MDFSRLFGTPLTEPPLPVTLGRSAIGAIILVACCAFQMPSSLLHGQDPATTEDTAPHSDDSQESSSAEELAALVAAQLQSIPDPRTLTRDDLPGIFLILDEGIAAGRKYIANHADSPGFPTVACDLGRMLILNVDRHLGELNEEAKIFGAPMTAQQRLDEQLIYLDEVVRNIERALATKISPALRCRAEVILGDCLLKSRNASKSADAFGRALQLDTSLEDADEIRIKQIEALEIAERYREMMTAGILALEEHPRTKFLPHLVYFTHKAHRHLGILRQGRDLWRLWGPVLEAGALGGEISLPNSDQKWQVPAGKESDFRLMADRAGFYEGFFQLAMGEKEAALQALLSYNEKLAERINSGETISMATKTYLDFQSLPMSHRIDVLHGKPAPSLAGLSWIQAPPENDPGKKVELRLFCDSNRATSRQSRFISLLKKLELEYSAAGLRVVWISSVLSSSRAETEAAAMTAIAVENRLGWSYGVQPGIEAGVIERHLGSHGGTLLLAIDDEGLLQWEMIDPMFWDEGLFRSIITRLLHNAE
ncbi:MAG TPA: hypothetical protein EYQ08_00970 [Planctomycetes bacterium]|nr:hypothetical protein [Planctomycetota bacterium]HIK82133.1 hypothetical protein [Planctomycetota bacterium]